MGLPAALLPADRVLRVGRGGHGGAITGIVVGSDLLASVRHGAIRSRHRRVGTPSVAA